MKSVYVIANDIDALYGNHTDFLPEGLIPTCRRIQLDAMKEGIRRASVIINMTPATDDRRESRAWYVKTLLESAEKLTEKDL